MTVDASTNMKLVWTGRVISTLIVLPMLLGTAMSFSNSPQVAEGMLHFGFPPSLLHVIGVIEAVTLILYAIPKTAVIGAILLTGYMGGAICTHLRMGESVVIQTILPILAWLGLYLREPRLWALLPFRK